jgi:hypothetical protein
MILNSVLQLTNRFIDGLRDDIRSVVLVHRPRNLDTASSIALLQEESSRDNPKRDYKKTESDNNFRFAGRPRIVTYNNSF